MTSRTVNGQTFNFGYDAENRLVSVSGAAVASFVYDGDGNRVQSTINGTTTTFIGNYYSVTDSIVTKNYYSGTQLIAVRKGDALSYLLSDHLGSISLTVDSSRTVTASQRFTPWGEVRAPSGTMQTMYSYTGLYSNVSDFGLLFYNARWYDPYLNQFTQPDSIIPQPYDPQSWNRYEYALDNPVHYNDPTGHRNCEEDSYNCPGDTYDPDVARQDMLFTRMFRGSGSNSAWTYKDWQYYDAHRNDLWRHPDQWINPDPEKGWNLFALHAKRLASYYSPDQQSDFVRDFALVFGGVPYSHGVIAGAVASSHGPAVINGTYQGDPYKSFLNEGNAGLNQQYQDIHPSDNQSHHYAGLFFLGYFSGGGTAQIINFARDSDNPGDLNLGSGAAEDGTNFHNATDLSTIGDLILNYVSQ